MNSPSGSHHSCTLPTHRMSPTSQDQKSGAGSAPSRKPSGRPPAGPHEARTKASRCAHDLGMGRTYSRTRSAADPAGGFWIVREGVWYQGGMPESLPSWQELAAAAASWWHGLEHAWLPRLAGAVLALVLALVGWLVARVVLRFLARQARRTKSEIDDLIIDGLRRIVGWVALAGGAWYAVGSLGIPSLARLVQAAVIVIVAVPATRVARSALAFLESRLASRTETKADDILVEISGRFSGIVIYGLALILALDHLGINVTPFIAGAGVAGVAVGFAAKDTLSNLVAGILLMLYRPFEKGDRIELWTAPPNSATWGDVIDIGLRATKIRSTDNIVIVIPNNEIMMRDIINYTAHGSAIRLRIRVGISYTADVAQAKALLVRVARELEWVVDEPSPPAVVVRSFGESSVDLELRIWIDDARKRIHTISHVTDRAHAEFKKAGIEIPYPKRDVYIHEVAPRAPAGPARAE
jgi:small-conductance mechanosensitive channel